MTRALALAAAIALAHPALAQVREVPDPHLTPGIAASTDPAQVCGRSPDGLTYSKSHRLSQTEAVKRQVLARYGVPWSDRGRYEDDHDVPLCAGGSDAVANRWPQPRFGAWTAADKDKVEAETCREICGGRLTPAEGQARFLAPADWRASYCVVYPDDQRCAALEQGASR